MLLDLLKCRAGGSDAGGGASGGVANPCSREEEVKWTDIIFREMVKKSKGNKREKLLRYRYGAEWSRSVGKVLMGVVSGAAGGAATGAAGGGVLGLAGGPAGAGLGAFVGAMVVGVTTGVAAGVSIIEQVKNE